MACEAVENATGQSIMSPNFGYRESVLCGVHRSIPSHPPVFGYEYGYGPFPHLRNSLMSQWLSRSVQKTPLGTIPGVIQMLGHFLGKGWEGGNFGPLEIATIHAQASWRHGSRYS
jgi:hypothetical protein